MFELLFKYSPAAFQDSELILASDWPLWLLFTLAGLGAAAILTSLFWKRKQFGGLQLAAVAALQLLMLGVALLVLWQPALVNERLLRGENAVAVLLDTSASMTFRDAGEPRMQQARRLLEEDALAPLADTYQVLPFAFTDEAAPLPSFEPVALPPPGQATDLGRSLLQALRQSANASLGAVILISDGADNAGGISRDRLEEIAAYGVPVHTVGMGRETVPEDLELQDVSLPDKAPPGTTLSARLAIRHDQGGTVRVRAYDGDEFLATREVTLDPAQRRTLAYMDIEAAEPGQMDLRFTLDPLPDESHLANNSRSAVVDVPDSRYRILYVEGEPRWEYKFMRRALQDDPSVRLTTLLRVTPNKYYRQGIDDPEELAEGFPARRGELFDYDALIIGSLEAAHFTEEQYQLIHDFVSERGGSLFMLAGRNGLGRGGWHETLVADILPARLQPDDADFVRQQVPVHLTDSGSESPMLQLDMDAGENRRQWSELPEVADYQHIGALRPAATALLEVEVDGRRRPLLVRQPYGRGQSWIMATGGTWRWQMSLPVEDTRHETFWRQISRGLVASSPRPFELSALDEGGRIRVRAEIRDPEADENSGLAISAIAANDHEAVPLDLRPVAGKPGIYEASFDPPGGGMYSIEAIARRGEEPVDSATTAIRLEQDQEAFGVRQNRALLENLAAATGGRYWQPDQWREIPEAIRYSTAGITEQDVRYLWDAPFFFLLLFLLKGAEWLTRRYWRAI